MVKSMKMSKKGDTMIQVLLWVVLAALVVCSGMYLMRMRKETFVDDAASPYHLVFLYSEQCPHCHTFMPEFQRFKSETLPKYAATLKVSDYEYKDAAARPYVKLPVVTGFPCLLLFSPEGAMVKEKVGISSAAQVVEFLKMHAKL